MKLFGVLLELLLQRVTHVIFLIQQMHTDAYTYRCILRGRATKRPPKLTTQKTTESTREASVPTLRDEYYELHASVCKGLADPKRLLIIDALREGERSVTEICDVAELPQSNISQHLAVLREKGLVVTRREGQRVYYAVASEKVTQALDLLLEVMRDHVIAGAGRA